MLFLLLMFYRHALNRITFRFARIIRKLVCVIIYMRRRMVDMVIFLISTILSLIVVVVILARILVLWLVLTRLTVIGVVNVRTFVPLRRMSVRNGSNRSKFRVLTLVIHGRFIKIIRKRRIRNVRIPRSLRRIMRPLRNDTRRVILWELRRVKFKRARRT